VQQLAIRREQLRIQELEPALRELVNTNPHRPAWRAALATLLCETDRLDEAREELEVLAAADFIDVPPDGDWMITMTLLADLIADVGDPDRAARVYEMLLPYGGANVVIGLAAVCLGATARYLGRLAATMGAQDEAAGLFERAIERNTALKAPIHLAHTQVDYARVLGTGPRARSLIEAAQRTAEELDLPMLKRRVERLQGE
jgi:tetratricopeptide (TPR) repeat protein